MIELKLRLANQQEQKLKKNIDKKILLKQKEQDKKLKKEKKEKVKLK